MYFGSAEWFHSNMTNNNDATQIEKNSIFQDEKSELDRQVLWYEISGSHGDELHKYFDAYEISNNILVGLVLRKNRQQLPLKDDMLAKN